MAQDTSTWIGLRSARLGARINPLGAQLSTLTDDAGRDLLSDGDPAVWAGRAPILFPIVGALAGGRYRLGSRYYALPRHGFARGKAFKVVNASESAAVLRLVSDDDTLQVYPFRFQLDVSFTLEGEALTVASNVSNTGEMNMPVSIGYHPALRWPLPYGNTRDSHYIEFEQEESAPIRRLDRDGLVTTQRQQTPVSGRRLRLEDALFRDDVVIFDELSSRSLTYGAATGPRIRVDFPDARYLGLWTRPGAGFICIEPWQGIADPAGMSGDLTDKPGIVNLPPAAMHSLSMRLTLEGYPPAAQN